MISPFHFPKDFRGDLNRTSEAVVRFMSLECYIHGGSSC